MQCPKCNHHVPEVQARCMYCGAVLRKVASPTNSDTLGSGASEKNSVTLFPDEADKYQTSFEIREESRVYDSLEDLPESLREKVKEAMKQGGGDCGVGFGTPEIQEILSLYSMPTTKRKKRMSPIALILICLTSAAVAAFIVWLLG